ncbi:hypothetical protein SAMN04488072_1023 [Lentibacillus halodurans]|uniref:Uncharacterized protein n=1 Tax=Lentibacillus halodurans TaxID=237679 RepID=A0A1I0VVS9_9BACI|nr:hypothetical protein [Lentibacillus halodurans]SFA80452.1 hypothetical protein SAMN04488072_1023 [Lentibacillus halodurans]
MDPLLERLTIQEIEEIMASSSEMHVPKNSLVFEEGALPIICISSRREGTYFQRN